MNIKLFLILGLFASTAVYGAEQGPTLNQIETLLKETAKPFGQDRNYPFAFSMLITYNNKEMYLIVAETYQNFVTKLTSPKQHAVKIVQTNSGIRQTSAAQYILPDQVVARFRAEANKFPESQKYNASIPVTSTSSLILSSAAVFFATAITLDAALYYYGKPSISGYLFSKLFPKK